MGLPALLAAAALGGGSGAGVGLVVLVAAALVSGWRRARQETELAAWLAELARGRRSPRPEGFDDWTDRHIAAPVLQLVRAHARARRRRRDLQTALADIVEAFPDPVLFVDPEFRVVHANSTARRRFELADERPVALFLLLRDPALSGAIAAVLRERTAQTVDVAPPGDPLRRYHARIAPLVLPDAGARGVILVLREISEQVAIERMRSDFVANASHELRTPLAAVLAAIETLRGPARDDAAARGEFLALMEREVRRMVRLVDDLLSLSRIEATVPQPPTERVDPRAVVQRVVEELRPLAERAGVTLEVRLPPTLPALVADAEQLHQLLANLVDNAIKYGGEGGRVEVVAEVHPRAPAEAGPLAGRPALALAVRDHGPGIAAEHLPRLTERFYRVDKARSREAGGTGLGLAIVKHVLRRHQGHLAIDSAPGRGSRFCAWLPLADRGAGGEEAPTAGDDAATS